MSYLADVRALMRKDLLLELRARDTLPAMLLFVIAIFAQIEPVTSTIVPKISPWWMQT